MHQLIPSHQIDGMDPQSAYLQETWDGGYAGTNFPTSVLFFIYHFYHNNG